MASGKTGGTASGKTGGTATASGAKNANIPCKAGTFANAKGKCVPETVVSPEFGGTGGGKREWGNCTPGDYVVGINAGYDDLVQEIKYLAWGCTSGQHWVQGRESPGSLGSKFVTALTMGITSGSASGYENQTFADPHNNKHGWNQVAYVLANGSQKMKPNRLRAIGPYVDHLFGVVGAKKRNFTRKHDVTDAEKLLWKCDSAGEAPVGKMWAVTGIGPRTGSAVDSVQFKCSLIDV
ncbi:hypothetical protein D9Q98_004069 [Chlorella vulgaris]|uniref:Uncharacterized protein n=1 Tax=Chlorella vulgaris TaxID=3077 RepID=A0A9D4YY18_CHLVU|nr:hypothetical protein D9Q98_004069 [Chlorella vulgaris]